MALVVRRVAGDLQGRFFDLTADVLIDGVEERLTFRRFGDHPDLMDRQDVADPFAVALLLPAMLRGVPLVLEADIDERLLLALRGPIQDTLRVLQPAWRKIAVSAGSRLSPTGGPTGRGGAAAMSGGVDSMHVLRRMGLGSDIPESLRIRLLMHHHVGAHGDDDDVFAEQYGHCRRIADRLGLPLVGASCSLTSAYRKMPFIQCVTMRNVAAAMSLDHLFDAFHFASTEPVGGRVKVGHFDGISVLDSQLLPWFDSARVTWFPFGGATTRLQKTAEVLADERLCHDLLVCIRGFRKDRKAVNCGQCFKCGRLLLHAEAVGRLSAVAATFDMEAFERGRGHCIRRLLWLALGPIRNPVDAELLVFLHDRGFPFPAWARPGVAAVVLLYGRSHSLEASGTPTD